MYAYKIFIPIAILPILNLTELGEKIPIQRHIMHVKYTPIFVRLYS